MEPCKLLAAISKQYLQERKDTGYRTKKTAELSEDEAIRACHCFCEENGLTGDFAVFRNKIESQWYCSLTQEFIDEGTRTDIQMIKEGYVKRSALSDPGVDFSKAASECEQCRYSIKCL